MQKRLQKILLFVVTVFVCKGLAFGQNPKLEVPFFKLDPNATAQDYEQGIVIAKLKKHLLASDQPSMQGNATIQWMLQGVKGTQGVKPMFGQSQKKSKSNQRLTKPPVVDLSQFYLINYDPAEHIEDVINGLYATGNYEYVEPYYAYQMADDPFTPNDSLVNDQYYLGLIKAFEAWGVTQGDSNIVIGIVDSGVDLDHPDLVNKIAYNWDDPIDGIDNDEDGYVDNFYGWDFAGATRSPLSEDNDPSVFKGGSSAHGTLVGGCAGAEVDNNIGIAGVGFRSKLLFTKHSPDDQPEDVLSVFRTIEGVVYAVEQGASIVNMSYGGRFRSQAQQDIMAWAALDNDVLLVAAAGNAGQRDLPQYPADYDYVLSVSATDRNDIKTNFSNYSTRVDIAAPGRAIVTTTFDDAYETTQGTSFASPIVAGAAALVRAHYPELSALQVAELLRVSANTDLYRGKNGNFRNRLGRGRLDIHKALTSQSPSIRLQSASLINTRGTNAQVGDTALFIGNFTNFLWPSTNALKARISTANNLVSFIRNEMTLGTIETGQQITYANEPFQFVLDDRMAENTVTNFLIEFTDGSYTDYQFFTVVLNPTIIDLEENLVTASIAGNGRVGHLDFQVQDGTGFVFDERNMLYEMGLMLGTSPQKLVNAVRSTNNNVDNHFQREGRISKNIPGQVSFSEITGLMTDGNARNNRLGLEVIYKAMSWVDEPDDKYIILEYQIKNVSDSTISDFYAGLYADWDVNQTQARDIAGWDADQQMGYVFSADPEDNHFAGVQVLTGDPHYTAIENDPDIEGNIFGVYDGFTAEEKFNSMSSGILREAAGETTEDGIDVSHIVGSGPYTIGIGETITVAFALHGAANLEDLKASAAQADTMYNFTLRAPQPVVPQVFACFGGSATLNATGATNYNWYTSSTGGQPFHTGASYFVENLLADSVYYVSNADAAYESTRTPAIVRLRAVPSIQPLGSTTLCQGDSVMLRARQADTYLWSTGEATQNIVVKEAGFYTVSVTDAGLGCFSESIPLEIVVVDNPTVDFDISVEEVALSDNVEILFTDNTPDAVAWLWEFGDGSSNSFQSPSHIYRRLGTYEVKLTVTNSAGCVGTASKVISVTALSPDLPTFEGASLFPNPASDLVGLQIENDYFGEVSLQIFNANGALVQTLSFQKNTTDHYQPIDLQNLSQGIYFLYLTDGQRAARRKLVKR